MYTPVSTTQDSGRIKTVTTDVCDREDIVDTLDNTPNELAEVVINSTVESQSNRRRSTGVRAANRGIASSFTAVFVQELLRGKAAIAIKVVQQISMGLIYGGIYSLGNDQSSSWIDLDYYLKWQPLFKKFSRCLFALGRVLENPVGIYILIGAKSD